MMCLTREEGVQKTLTDVIEEELRRALRGGWDDPATVIARFSKSKGPLYIALARVLKDAAADVARLGPNDPKELAPARSHDEALAYALALRVQTWILSQESNPLIAPPPGVRSRPVPLSKLSQWLLKGLYEDKE